MGKHFDSQAYQLMKAVMAGDAVAVDAELAKNPDLDWQDSQDMTSLHHAVKIQRPDIAQKLLDAGANTRLKNKLGESPLTIAAEAGDEPSATVLLAKDTGAAQDKEENALPQAASQKHAGMVKLLIAAKFDVDHLPTAGKSALMFAATKNDIPTMTALLDANANPNLRYMRGDTAILFATQRNAYDAVKLLIDRGADEKLSNIDGFTPGLVADKLDFTGITELIAKADEARAAAEIRRIAGLAETIAAQKQARIDILKPFKNGAGREVASPGRARFKPKTF